MLFLQSDQRGPAPVDQSNECMEGPPTTAEDSIGPDMLSVPDGDTGTPIQTESDGYCPQKKALTPMDKKAIAMEQMKQMTQELHELCQSNTCCNVIQQTGVTLRLEKMPFLLY